MSKKSTPMALRNAMQDGRALEVNPLRSTIYIPQNKQSVWVYQKDTKVFDHDSAGVWSIPNFKLDKTSRNLGPVEVWCFFDDDPLGIEESVLRNNPSQGAWGYTSSVVLKTRQKMSRPATTPSPHNIVLIPPGQPIPEGIQVAGVWVSPVMKRDMSSLADGTSGFIQVSGQIKRAEKHSIGGAWKVLGHNDEIAKGRKKANAPTGDAKGNWTIHVRTTKGKSFPISVIPGNKITQCQEKILKKKGIPIEDQRLCFDGTPLEEQKTILGSGIRNGDTIDMGPMEIFVRTCKGKKFKFQVDPDELVQDVKTMAAPKVGITPDKQRLFFKRIPLTNDHDPISAYKIKHKSVLDLADMVIFVEPLVGPRIELDVEPIETMKQVKIKVKNRIKMPVEEQRLYFKGLELTTDKASLEDSGIQHLDTLTMQPDPPPAKRQKATPKAKPLESPSEDDEMIIYVIQDWDKKKFSLHVESTHKMLQVKRQIYQLQKIPVKQQLLTFKRKPVKNSKTIEESKVKHKSVLHLEVKVIRVQMPDGTMTKLDVNPNDTVSSLPDLIAKVTDQPPSDQLWQRDNQLDPNTALSEIPEDEPIIVKQPIITKPKLELPKPGNIYIQPAKGKKFPLRVDPKSYDLPEFKNIVGMKINRPPRKFQIINDETGETLNETTVPVPGTTYSIKDMPDPQTVTVKPLNGRDFHLMIDPDDTIKDLKRKATKLTGYPIHQLRLVDDDGDEPDDETKPRLGKTFHVVPPEVDVEPISGPPIRVAILPKDTIGDVKDRIADLAGIPRGKQRNFFLDGDTPFDISDDTPVGQTRLEHGTKLQQHEPSEITVDIPRLDKNRKFNVVIDPDDTIKDVKKKLVVPTGFPVRYLHLVDDEGDELDDDAPLHPGRTYAVEPPHLEVESPDGILIKLEILPTDTLGSVKDKIADAVGVPKGNARNFYFDGDNPLIDSDDTPLTKTKLHHGAKITVKTPPEIFVDLSQLPNGRSVNLIIDPDDTIMDVKRRLVSATGFPIENIKLVDNDRQTLNDVTPTEPGRTYYLEPPEVEVELPNKKRVKLSLFPHRTVEDVKDIIEEKTGIPKAQQHIFTDEKVPLSNEIELCKVGLKEGFKLKMQERKEVTIKTPSGRSFTIDIDLDNVTNDHQDSSMDRPSLQPSHTISDIKDIIEKKNGIPASKQRIFVVDEEKNELDDKTLISQANIKHGSVLDMQISEKKVGNFKLSSGRSFVLLIDPEDTAKDIVRKVAQHISVHPDDIQIFIEGHEADEDRFDPKQLSHGDILLVEPKKIEIVLPCKNRVCLQIQSTHTVEDLKQMIENETGTPKIKQRLFFYDIDGGELDDKTPVSKSGIEPGSALAMTTIERFEIPFKTPGGRMFIVIIDAEDSVKKVREKIALQGIDMANLSMLDLDGEEMSDTEPFLSYKIRLGEQLTLQPSHVEIHASSATKLQLSSLPTKTIPEMDEIVERQVIAPKASRRAFFLDNEGTDLSDDLPSEKTKLQHGTSIDLKPLDDATTEVVFKSKGGRSFAVLIDPVDTVKVVKEKFRTKFGLSIGGPMLDELNLDDFDEDALFLDLNPCIRHSAFVIAEPPQAMLAPGSAEKVAMQTHSTIPIAEVNEVVEESATECKMRKQRIYFFDNEDESGDEAISKKLNLESGTKLEQRHFKLIIEHWNGERATINVEPTEYIDDVKDKIFNIFMVPVEQQYITLKGIVVRDDINLKKQNIDEKSVLQLHPMEIYVIDPDGNKHSFVVSFDDSIICIKEKLVHETGIPVNLQYIFKDDAELLNERSLQNSNIRYGDILSLQVYRIDVVSWDGEKWSMNGLMPCDTVSTLKLKIEEAKNVPSHLQKLKHNGTYLADSGTLGSLGVQHRNLIVLEDPNEIDTELPDCERLSLHLTKKKQFQIEEEVIWPVVPNWKERIFFFDNDSSVDDGLVDLTLLLWTGKNFIVNGIRLGATVDELMQRVQKLLKTPIDNQTIAFNGKDLDPKRTLRQQMVLHKSVLVMKGERERNIFIPDSDKIAFGMLPAMIVNTITITVRHWRGENCTIDAQPTDYVDDLRETIWKVMKIPMDQQRLAYNGEKVSETESISKQGIISGSSLYLEPMQIVIKLQTDTELSFTVELTDTVHNIKMMIFKETRVPIETQCLLFGAEELLDSQTLEECDISHDDILQMEEFSVSIMDFNGETFRLSGIRPDDTIGCIESRIFESMNDKDKQRVLSFHGNTLDKKKKLKDEKIKHRSVLILQEASTVDLSDVPHRKISFMKQIMETSVAKTAFEIKVVHWNGNETFTVESEPTDYADDFKERIQKKHGIPVEQQTLSFQGAPLRDDVNFQKLQIHNGSTLYLEPMQLMFELPNGTNTTLVVEPSYTIQVLKDLLRDKGHVQDEGFCLLLGGLELQNCNTLDDYQLHHEEVLTIERYKVIVIDASGTHLELVNINPNSSVESVQEEIMLLKSIPKERQRLSYQGKTMDSSNTLLAEGIHHKSVIILEEVEFTVPSPRREKYRMETLPTAMDVALAARANKQQLHEISDRNTQRDFQPETPDSPPMIDSTTDYLSGGSKVAPILEAQGLSCVDTAQLKWWEKQPGKVLHEVGNPTVEKRVAKKIKYKKRSDVDQTPPSDEAGEDKADITSDVTEKKLRKKSTKKVSSSSTSASKRTKQKSEKTKEISSNLIEMSCDKMGDDAGKQLEKLTVKGCKKNSSLLSEGKKKKPRKSSKELDQLATKK